MEESAIYKCSNGITVEIVGGQPDRKRAEKALEKFFKDVIREQEERKRKEA